ncbi:MAG: hypothetical protein H7Z74_04920 [Anaerolineae bacterium]|nr:hypothetical protein [Gemmatimonadaceae bacterium]
MNGDPGFPNMVCRFCASGLSARLPRGRNLAFIIALIPASTQVAGAQAEGHEAVCNGQIITDIQVNTRAPYEPKSRKWWTIPIRIANSLHATTDESVIRRYLILARGMQCSEFRRAESERILRVQPYLASAEIQTLSDGLGGVILRVETVDELTTIVGAGASGTHLTGLRLGDRNIMGSATSVIARWRESDIRDVFAVEFTDYQFLGRRYILDADMSRREIGSPNWSADVRHPFFTDQQRFAWRVKAEDTRELFHFLREGNVPSAVIGIERSFMDAGGVVRIGLPGRLSLFGISFSREVDEAMEPPNADSTVNYTTLLAPYKRRNNSRINALWALRNIYFRRVERFDALNAAQDIRLGFQASTLFGRSLSISGATDDDILVAADIYGGLGGERTFLSINVRGEGHQNYDNNEWDGILGSGNIAAYRRLGDKHTVKLNVDWSGGWKQRTPFQLSLGDSRGGVRGYRRSRAGGGRRGVLRLEERWYVGDFREQAGLGLAFFADAGRLWAGDVPYGVDTPVKLGAGIGLLAAVPKGSKRTWRLDVAFPLSADGKAKWEFRLSNLNANRVGWREPQDLARSRERAVPNNVF